MRSRSYNNGSIITMTDNFENKFKEYEDGVIKSLESLMMRILLKLHRDADKIIRDNKAIASAEMVKNLREQVYFEAGKIVGVFGVGANVPYGIFRHEDTRPHFPPIAPLMKWVIQKGLLKDSKGKPTTMKRAARQGDEGRARAIAFLIARKIARKGTKGLPFLKMALQMNTDFIIKSIRTATA